MKYFTKEYDRDYEIKLNGRKGLVVEDQTKFNDYVNGTYRWRIVSTILAGVVIGIIIIMKLL